MPSSQETSKGARMDEPRPTKDLDASLAHVIRRGRNDRRIIIGIVLVAVIVLGVVIFQVHKKADRNSYIITRTDRSECAFYASIGNTVPPTNVTLVGTTILVEARNGFYSLGCASQILVPQLTLPSQELLAAARKYHIRVMH